MSSGCEIMLCDHCKIFRLRGKRNEINPPTPAGISHGEAIFHTQSVFHKSRKGFISLKRNNLCPKDKGCFFSGAGYRSRTFSDKTFLCSLQNSHDENDTAGNNCPKPHGASARGEGMPRYNDKSSFPSGTDIIEGAASQQPFCCFETTPLTHIRFFLPRFCCRGI